MYGPARIAFLVARIRASRSAWASLGFEEPVALPLTGMPLVRQAANDADRGEVL